MLRLWCELSYSLPLLSSVVNILAALIFPRVLLFLQWMSEPCLLYFIKRNQSGVFWSLLVHCRAILPVFCFTPVLFTLFPVIVIYISFLFCYLTGTEYLLCFRYIYIPLGGSRHGFLCKVLSTGLAFGFICFWHGGHDYLRYWALMNWAGVLVENGLSSLFASSHVHSVIVGLKLKHLAPTVQKHQAQGD